MKRFKPQKKVVQNSEKKVSSSLSYSTVLLVVATLGLDFHYKMQPATRFGKISKLMN